MYYPMALRWCSVPNLTLLFYEAIRWRQLLKSKAGLTRPARWNDWEPPRNPRCKNFLVAGVITAEMRRRLDQSRLFEKDFQLVELLSDETRQAEFYDEIFNHTLRMFSDD